MENTLQTNRPDTLMNELSKWNRQENQFGALFGQEALRDREFLKMKLEHYDRLYYKYQGKPQTQDEKAMMTMLRFQRRKMERALYPGLLRRLLHRGRARLTALLNSNRENVTTARQQDSLPAHQLPAIVKEMKTERQQATVRQMTPVSRYAQQNRQAKRNNKNRKKGRSI